MLKYLTSLLNACPMMTEKGATLIEYVLMIAGIAIALVSVVLTLGTGHVQLVLPL